MTKNQEYEQYKSGLIDRLIEASGKDWADGCWKRKGKRTEIEHILPLSEDSNTAENRSNAIKKYLGIDCVACLGEKLKGLHQYAHHLNSSQLMCVGFFGNLIDQNHRAKDEMVKFIKDALSLDIQPGAECQFEYHQREDSKYVFDVDGKSEYEGTSFDFHIKDENDVELFFEIKLTENGFGKADKDGRHKQKAKKYAEHLPEFYSELKQQNKISPDSLLEYYQLFRNIIRAENENKFVVIITDANNPATNKEIKDFTDLFGTPNNVKFITWQEVKEIVKDYYPTKLLFQFKAL